LLYSVKVKSQVQFLENTFIERENHKPRIRLVLFFKKIRGYLDKNNKKKNHGIYSNVNNYSGLYL